MARPAAPKYWQVAIAVAVAAVFFVFFRPANPLGLEVEDQVCLLRLARQQLVAAARGEGLIDVDPADFHGSLSRPASCFVSLSRGDAPRGCMIDRFEPHEPLYRNVLWNTILAASGDDRFPSVTPDEVDDLRIEISVVSDPEQVMYQSPDDLLGALEPGVDGVILDVDGRTSAFLPWVWEAYPDPAMLLSELCVKQGQPRHRWKETPYPRIEVFRAFSFSE